MNKILDDYISDIEHFLAVRQGRADILKEIRSHLIERAEKEAVEPESEDFGRIILEYGSAREVADRYNEDIQIIAPSFLRYLVRYTAFLFSLHMILTVTAVLTHSRMIIFPFFVIPRMEPAAALFYIPMSLVYDLGLVGLFLYLVTQRRGREIRLPWLNVNFGRWSGDGPEKAKPVVAVVLLILLILAVIGIFKQKTLFVYSVNLQNPESFLNPEASRLFSLVVIGLIAVELFTQILRIAVRSSWLDAANNAVWLGAVWWMLNYPGDGLFRQDIPEVLPGILKSLGTTILVIVAVFSSWGFIKAVVRLLPHIHTKGGSLS